MLQNASKCTILKEKIQNILRWGGTASPDLTTQRKEYPLIRPHPIGTSIQLPPNHISGYGLVTVTKLLGIYISATFSTVTHVQHILTVASFGSIINCQYMCRVSMQICGLFMSNILQIKQFMYHGVNAQNTVINSYEIGKLKMKFLHWVFC